MGFAQILSGGPNGRYTIQVDFGSSDLAAIQATQSNTVIVLEGKLLLAEAEMIIAEEQETEQRERIAAVTEALILAQVSAPVGSPFPNTKEVQFEIFLLQQIQLNNAPLRRRRDALKFTLAEARRRLASFANVRASETRQAWCADLTTNAAIGSFVATLDLPGESNLILVAPSARPWQPSDGLLKAREVMSPAQAFWCAAVLPGWQKYKPTYRWGTITVVNYEANVVNVSLASQPSSARGLPINQTETLTAVPVSYMECDSVAFDVGDRCVVQFLGQSWQNPRVIGFLDNPKPCLLWPSQITMDLVFEDTNITANSPRPWIVIDFSGLCGGYYYARVQTYDALTANDRDHIVYASSPAIDSSSYSVETEGGTFGSNLWTGHSDSVVVENSTSSAFWSNPQTYRVPRVGSTGTFFRSGVVGGGNDQFAVRVGVASFSESETLPNLLDGGCISQGSSTGGAWPNPPENIVVSDNYAISPTAPLSWMQTVGAKPTRILARHNATGRRREYVYSSYTRIPDAGGGINRVIWRMSFFPGPFVT